MVERMVREQKDMRIPSELVPRCPRCAESLVPNLRIDDSFVEEESWHAAQKRYEKFLADHRKSRIVLLEIGVGGNTPPPSSSSRSGAWRRRTEMRPMCS